MEHRDKPKQQLLEELNHAEQSLSWLSATAIELVGFPPERDLEEFICQKTKELVGNAVVSVNSIDEQRRVLRVRKLAGIGRFKLEQAEALFGGRFVGASFDGVYDEAVQALLSGSLAEVQGGLHQLFFGRVPKAVCSAIEKLVGIEKAYSIGLRHNGRLYGSVTIITRKGARLHKEVIEAFLNQASAALERRMAEGALNQEQKLLRQLLELHERERRLISYEIHDGLAQHIFGAQMRLQALESRLNDLPDQAKQNFQAALHLLDCGGKEARALVSHLRPPILDESGILAAVDFLVAEQSSLAPVEIQFDHDGSFDNLASVLQVIVFRIVQEGLANACRHSRSDRVHVALTRRNGAIRLQVKDWGCGFDPQKIADDRFGLEGIRERARLFGGNTEIQTAPEKGTCITVELPDANPLSRVGEIHAEQPIGGPHGSQKSPAGALFRDSLP